MNKISFLKIIFLFTVFALFTNANFEPSNNKDPLLIISKNYHVALNYLEARIDTLTSVASLELVNDSLTLLLKKEIKDTRLAFKETEMLFNYFDPDAINKHINGPPLVKVEPKVSEIKLISPKGLQVLDELIFADELSENKNKIIELCKQLKQSFATLKRHQSSIKIGHRHVFESSRESLIRIASLGITGFDTPGSLNAIQEAEISLTTIKNNLELYYPLLEEKNKRAIAFNLFGSFQIGIEMLQQNQDFNTFDRFTFINKVINPLYEQIQKAHTVLGIETIDEVPEKISPVNFTATNIFDKNLLNPNYYSNLNNGVSKNKERAALGKLLFFDPVLSKNNNISCATCHDPQLAFTDGMVKSKSNNGETELQRNSPTLINSVYAEKYFYDLRESKLERQIKHVVLDHKEFDTDFDQIVQKLKGSNTYVNKFENAYEEHPNYSISKWSISNALATYVSELNSFNSPFDQYMRYETVGIDPEVKKGFNLFMGKAACGTCHFAPTFSGLVPPLFIESESEILGVPKSQKNQTVIDHDLGRYGSMKLIDQTEIFKYAFKTTTVRNVELTAPYMHNGIFNTLEEVIEFYNKGGGNGQGMNLVHQTLPSDSLDLSEEEQQQIISFLKSLTDNPFENEKPIGLPKFENNEELNDRYK